MGCAIIFYVKVKGDKHEASIPLTGSPSVLHQNIIAAMKSLSSQHGKHTFMTWCSWSTKYMINAIVKAYQDLMHAIQGVSNIKGNAHMEALRKMQELFEPHHILPATLNNPSTMSH